MASNLNGKIKMNNISDCFNVGSIVTCKTCYQKDIEGEVLAFDAQTKILILKSTADNGRQSVSDINFVNLNFVSDVQVIKEVTTAAPVPLSLNINMLKNRLKNNVDGKKRWMTSLQSGVTPEGQKLFLTISKTIAEVRWDGLDILVYDSVRIVPPYKPENVTGAGSGSENTKGIAHIRKVVEKYLEDALSAKKDIPASTNSNNVNTSCTPSSSGGSNGSITLPQ